MFYPLVLSESRAQRLSASSEFSPGNSSWSCSAVSRCSTPFGIIGILTPLVDNPNALAACAQRLSASSEFSPRSFEYAGEKIKCSTPFGIIGILTHQTNPETYAC